MHCPILHVHAETAVNVVARLGHQAPTHFPLKQEQQFQNVFRKIASEYEDVGFGEIADEANGIANTLKETGGMFQLKLLKPRAQMLYLFKERFDIVMLDRILTSYLLIHELTISPD